MSSKAGSQAQIRVIREEPVQAPMRDPQQSFPLPEIPPSPSVMAAAAFTVADSLQSRVLTPAAQLQATPITEAQRLNDLSRGFQAMLGVTLTISMVLAVRLMLLVTILVAGALAWRTLGSPTWMDLSVSAAFNFGVVLPVVALYWKRG